MSGLSTINKDRTEYPPVPREVYEIRVNDIEEKQGQYGAYWSWRWEITEPPYEGRYLWLFSDNNVSPVFVRKAGKVGPRDLASILLNRPLADDEFLEGNDYLDLIGLPARGSVGIAPSKDGTLRNTLESVLSAKGAKAPVFGAAAQAPSTPPSPVSSTDQKLFEKYLTLRGQLEWTKEVAEEMIEDWTEKAVGFQKLTLDERKLVVRKMEELDEANDIPFDSTGEEEEDELTAAGLVSPTAPAAATKRGK